MVCFAARGVSGVIASIARGSDEFSSGVTDKTMEDGDVPALYGRTADARTLSVPAGSASAVGAVVGPLFLPLLISIKNSCRPALDT